MNQILLSFLCGVAIVGGSAVVFCGLTIMWKFRNKSSRDEAKKQMDDLLQARMKTNEFIEYISIYFRNKKD